MESRVVLTTIDLANLGSAGTTLFGADVEDFSGISVSDAGDVNGDGVDDLLIGASLADATDNSRIEAGECYVVFGGPTMSATLDLANLGLAGITISGAEPYDFTGISVSGAGDINGDGFDDLLVGSHHVGTPGVDEPPLRGKCYVIFGGASLPSTLDLSDPVSVGVAISGAGNGDFIGTSVSGAGDVNGDGFDDIVVGDFDAYQNGSGIFGSGASYVIFGAASLPATFTVDNLGPAGVTIFGGDFGDSSGRSVSNAGDVNGDGFDDLLVGAERARASANAKTYAGETYVILGRASFPAVLNLSNLGSGGLTIYGADPDDRSGYVVSDAGDVNGDGFDDILIGTYRADAAGNAKSDAGESYLIFGGTTLPATIDLSALATAGIAILGADAGDHSGHSVSGAGDINGDGFDDLLIGSYDAAAAGNNKPSAGEAYVIFGKPSLPATIDLADINELGIAILGADINDRLGRSVSGAGDVDGDGFDDLIVGAATAYASENNKRQAGESYVIFGGNSFTNSVTHLGAENADTLTGDNGANTINGAGGDDTLAGNGGADVIYGGEGNDAITISDTTFRRINGGNGSDTLRFEGAGVNWDLRNLADNKLTSIETIDIRGSGRNMLTLDLREVLNITSGSNAAHTSNTLVVRRDSDDGVTFDFGWTSGEFTRIDGIYYRTLTQGTATLYIEIPPTISAVLSSGLILVSSHPEHFSDSVVTRDLVSQEIVVGYRTENVVTTEFRFPIASVTVGLRATLGDYNDRFDASLGGLPVALYGGGGDDSLIGGSFDDVLSGENGNDVLTGSAGRDTLEGGAGTLDTLDAFYNSHVILTAYQMTTLGGGNEVRNTVSGFERARILGGNSDNRIDASLSDMSVTLFGGNGNDTLIGGTKDDFLYGQAGDNSLVGGHGRDQVFGGDGNDTLTGGAGSDSLNAGANGVDLFFDIYNTDVVMFGSRLDAKVNGQTVEWDDLTGIDKLMIWGGGGSNLIDISSFDVPATLYGGGGNDTLIGASFDDSLDGQAGNDMLIGGTGTDSYVGGTGNDTFVEASDQNLTLTNTTLLMSGNSRPDVLQKFSTIEFADLSGGISRNRIDVSGFTLGLGTTIKGGGQSDTVIGSPATDIITTLTGHDVINGMGGSDVVYGGGGNDTITGGDGDDNLNGQNGDDSISGDADNDVLIGGAGLDTMTGGLGNDFLSGQAEAGLLNGGDGNDTLQGNTANDTLNGDTGDDRLYGLQGNDIVAGGEGADLLIGAAGNDSLNGGAGADTLQGDIGSDTIDGGADFDRINEVLDTNLTIVGINITTTSFGTDAVSAVERIQVSGGAGANFFDARQASVPVFLGGNAGNDTLLGGSKADGIVGGDGNDVISGGAGVDILDGGAGTDVVYEVQNTDFTVSGVQLSSAVTGTETPVGIEGFVLIGGASNNKLDASMSSLPVTLLGAGGNDTLLGSAQADVLVGGQRSNVAAGTDSLNGNAGADIFDNDAADQRTTGAGDQVVANVFASLPTWVDAI